MLMLAEVCRNSQTTVFLSTRVATQFYPHRYGIFLRVLIFIMCLKTCFAIYTWLVLEIALPLQRSFFIIVLDLRLTKLVKGCRETAFNCMGEFFHYL